MHIPRFWRPKPPKTRSVLASLGPGILSISTALFLSLGPATEINSIRTWNKGFPVFLGAPLACNLPHENRHGFKFFRIPKPSNIISCLCGLGFQNALRRHMRFHSEAPHMKPDVFFCGLGFQNLEKPRPFLFLLEAPPIEFNSRMKTDVVFGGLGFQNLEKSRPFLHPQERSREEGALQPGLRHPISRG